MGVVQGFFIFPVASIGHQSFIAFVLGGMVELAMDTGLDKNQENLVATISAEAESLLSIFPPGN